jgi:hypothetical protein
MKRIPQESENQKRDTGLYVRNHFLSIKRTLGATPEYAAGGWSSMIYCWKPHLQPLIDREMVVKSTVAYQSIKPKIINFLIFRPSPENI